MKCLIKFFLLFLISLLNESLFCENNNKENKELVYAIKNLRNINIKDVYIKGKTTQKEIAKNSKNIILKFREEGIQKLKEEINKVVESKENDYFFLQEASYILWQINGLKEIDYILSIWNQIPYEQHSNGVYYTAIEAAKLRKTEALPILKYCLKNHKGTFFWGEKEIHITWPLTTKIIWSYWGYNGLPILTEILKSTEESFEAKQSAIIILTQAQYKDALPLIRKFLENNNHQSLKATAICSLGIFGHPQDFDLLINNFENLDNEELWARAYALFEYEDLRAVPYLIKKLNSANAEARFEVLAALSHLYTKESIKSIIEYCKNPKNKREEKFCFYYSINFEKDTKTKLDSFSKLNEKEKDDVVFGLIERKNNRYKISNNNKNFSRDDFLKLKLNWDKNKEIFPAGYENIKIGDLINILAEEDIPILYNTISAIYDNLKEESFADIATLEEIIKYLSRKRYRSEIALTNIAQIK